MATTTDETSPRLRPLSLGEILDVSIKICLAHWRTLLKAVLVVVVPVQIAGTIANADYTVDSLDLNTGTARTPEETLEQFNQYLGGLAIAGVLQILAVLLATAACLRAIAQAYLGEETDWRSSLSYALRLAPSLLLLTLLYGLAIVLGLLLLILPGIWLYVAWAFATPALLVEGLRGRRALARSFGLVRGRWWRTFGVLIVGFVLAVIISALVQAVFLVGILADEGNDTLVLALTALAGIVGLAVSTPFQAALLTVLYFDLRVRKEGFDLELLAQEIGGGVRPGAPEARAAAPATVMPPADEPSTVMPPADERDRAGAPYWPPPPGWRPGGGAGRDGSADDGLRPPEERRPPEEPPRLPGVPHE